MSFLDNHQYEPGIRNINDREKKSRRETGTIALLCTLALVAFLKVAEAPIASYLIIMVPLWFFVMGFLQSFYGFCANFAFRGLQNAYRGHDDPEKIMSEAAREYDKQQAWRLIGKAASISLLLTVVITVILN